MIENALEGTPSRTPRGESLLDVRGLVQEFVTSSSQGRRRIQAVSGVSLTIAAGETLALVGESGCGKSSLARAILQLPRPMSGEVIFKGRDLVKLHGERLRDARRGLQAIFQDPFSSLDPRWTVEEIVAEPLVLEGVGSPESRHERVGSLLAEVGLDLAVHGRRRPRELSGGQCQRVAIARALALHPQLIVCDEPVSSLDVSVQAQTLNLFEQLREELAIAYLFITHDLAVARHVSDRIAVMYRGKIVEVASSVEFYRNPRHPYAMALLSAIPDPKATVAQGGEFKLNDDASSDGNPASGCRFRLRCPLAQPICAEVEPLLEPDGQNHAVACHFAPAGARVVGS